MPPTVIVFGPTGQCASVAARTARSHGAKVVLAMRDPAKSIDGLSPEEERKGGFERVQADLLKPDSVASAAKSTGATRAFIYFTFGTQDYMRATLEALKSGGVEFVVFLSSSSIGMHRKALKDIPRDAIIPHGHGMVEANLEEVFGRDHFVAVRPGFFTTNLFRQKAEILKGEVKIQAPHLTWDCIAPEDIGEVSGTILATQTGPDKGQSVVYLYGPQNLSMTDIITTIGRAVGKDVKVTAIGPEEQLQQYLSANLPRPLAEYFVKEQGVRQDDAPIRASNEEGVENVKRYIGRPGTTLDEWIQANKQLFAS